MVKRVYHLLIGTAKTERDQWTTGLGATASRRNLAQLEDCACCTFDRHLLVHGQIKEYQRAQSQDAHHRDVGES